MDERALKALPRAQIQKLARREHIKANAKTVLIIRQLCAKYPDGVLPLQEAAKPQRGSSRVEKMKEVKEEEEEDVLVIISGEPRPSKRRRPAGEAQEEPPAQKKQRRAVAEPAVAAVPQPIASAAAPTARSTWGILQELRGKVDEAPKSQHRLQEIHLLVRTAAQELATAQAQLRELQDKRKVIERHFLSQLKRDQRLWDGSHSWESAEPEMPVELAEPERTIFKIKVPARAPSQNTK